MNSNKTDDQHFEDYLSGESELSRLYRQGADEIPSAVSDARIRAAAQRATSRRRRIAFSPFATHWMVPASVAAVVIISASLVLLVQVEPEQSRVEIDELESVRETPAVTETDSPATKRSVSPPLKEMRIPRGRESVREDRETAATDTQKREALEGARYRAAPTAPSPEVPPGMPPEISEDSRLKSDTGSSVPEFQQREADELGAPSFGEKAFSQEAPGEAGDKPPTAGVVLEAEGTTAPSPVAPAEVTRPSPPQAAQPGRAVRAISEEPATAPAAENALERNRTLRDVMPPKDWLEEIQTLLKQGKLSEARESLAAFRQHYPSYPLSKSLLESELFDAP